MEGGDGDITYSEINIIQSVCRRKWREIQDRTCVIYSNVNKSRNDGCFSQSSAQNSEPLPTQHGHGIFMAQHDLAPMAVTPLREAKQRFYLRPQFLLLLCAIFFNLTIILGVLYSLEESAHVAALRSLDDLNISHEKVSAEKASLQKQLNESRGELLQLNSRYTSLAQQRTSVQNQLDGINKDLQIERDKNSKLSLEKETTEHRLNNVTMDFESEKEKNKRLTNDNSSQLKQLNTLKYQKKQVEAERDHLKGLHSETQTTLNEQKIRNAFLLHIKDSIEEELKKYQTTFPKTREGDQGKMMSKMLQALGTGCAIGWKNLTGQCYFLSNETYTWNQSKDACQVNGAHLVIIDTVQKRKFLMDQTPKDTESSYWIGLTDTERENRWLWVDNKVLDLSKSHWMTGQPDNWKGKTNEKMEGEDCVRTNGKEGLWLDAFCDEQFHYICETKAAVKS